MDELVTTPTTYCVQLNLTAIVVIYCNKRYDTNKYIVVAELYCLYYSLFFIKETGSRCIAQAALQCLFTGANPLLSGTGALTCSVSDLGRFTPP